MSVTLLIGASTKLTVDESTTCVLWYPQRSADVTQAVNRQQAALKSAQSLSWDGTATRRGESSTFDFLIASVVRSSVSLSLAR
jgi:hypothetical protein